jgi:transcriptional regulator with XRE-family HTH domain
MLEEIRRLFGLTQEQLASRIFVKQSQITQIESGTSKSAPLIKKISRELGIKESLLTSSGKYEEYPFLKDFYIFSLNEKKLGRSYDFIIKYFCSESSYIDVIFFGKKIVPILNSAIVSMALRDDRDTIFLFKRRVKIPDFSSQAKVMGAKQRESIILPALDYFRTELHELQETAVFEKTVRISEELHIQIQNDNVRKKDISVYFPSTESLIHLGEVHRKIKPR